MFKILIKNREIESTSTIEKYSYYQESGKDFETEDKNVAISKTNDLLDVYLRKDIQIVEVYEVKTQITTEIPDIDASIDSNIIPENIKKGIEILGVIGTYEGEPNNETSEEPENNNSEDEENQG